MITGAILVSNTHPDFASITNDLTFVNPFEDLDFKAFKEVTEGILIPRGYPIDTSSMQDNTVESTVNIEVAKGYTLRPYQQVAMGEIYEYFKSRPWGQILFTAQTGSGKTYSLAGLLSRMKLKTLLVSHLTMLSNQMLDELSANLKSKSIGILNSKSKVMPDIAIASFQLLASNSELLKLCADTYSIVFVDEAENSFTRSRLDVLYALRNKYTIITTATPTKELMKQTQGIRYLYGDKVVSMVPPDHQQIHSKHCILDFSHLRWQAPEDTRQYKTSLGRFMLSSGILQKLAELLINLKPSVKGTYWIIIDLTAVQDKMEQLLIAKGFKVETIRGTTGQKERIRILKDIALGNVDILLGSAPLSAGISIPELTLGIRLLPNSSSDELLEQQKGRLRRFHIIKEVQHPLWIDFLIAGSLTYGLNNRRRLYAKSTQGFFQCKPEESLQTIQKEVTK